MVLAKRSKLVSNPVFKVPVELNDNSPPTLQQGSIPKHVTRSVQSNEAAESGVVGHGGKDFEKRYYVLS